MTKMNLTRTDALDALHNFVMEVVFTKNDGTDRLMICTLSKEYIPEAQPSSVQRKYNPDIVRVFDLEKFEWRSFYLTSVKSFTAYIRV